MSETAEVDIKAVEVLHQLQLFALRALTLQKLSKISSRGAWSVSTILAGLPA